MTAVAEEPLLEELRSALRHAPRPVREIEVGTALSIALGRRRPAVACGGCSTPLEFEGVPARTVVGLKVPFRLISDEPASRGN
jgi:hypothetical protein